MNFTKNLDLSSNTVFFTVWLASTLSVSYLAISLSNMLFIGRMPDISNALHVEILQYTYFALVLSNGTVFLIFLLLLKHVNRLRAQLGYRVRHDALTGILSRGAFLEDFNKEYEKKREKRNDAFLIVDADFFKKINDTHGHLVGDKALVAIAQVMKNTVRENDKVGRLGGEEFVAHLKDVSIPMANEIAERMRRQVKRASDSLGIPNLELSVSIGLVGYEKNPKPKQVMALADRLLYKAKESGRDRVEVSYTA